MSQNVVSGVDNDPRLQMQSERQRPQNAAGGGVSNVSPSEVGAMGASAMPGQEPGAAPGGTGTEPQPIGTVPQMPFGTIQTPPHLVGNPFVRQVPLDFTTIQTMGQGLVPDLRTEHQTPNLSVFPALPVGQLGRDEVLGLVDRINQFQNQVPDVSQWEQRATAAAPPMDMTFPWASNIGRHTRYDNRMIPNSSASVPRGIYGGRAPGDPEVDSAWNVRGQWSTFARFMDGLGRDAWDVLTGQSDDPQFDELINAIIPGGDDSEPTLSEAVTTTLNAFERSPERGLAFLQSFQPSGTSVENYRFDPLRGYFGEMGTGLVGATMYGMSLPENIGWSTVYSVTDAAQAFTEAYTGTNNVGIPMFDLGRVQNPQRLNPLRRYEQAFTGTDLDLFNFRDGSGDRYLSMIPVMDSENPITGEPTTRGDQVVAGLGAFAVSLLFGDVFENTLGTLSRRSRNLATLMSRGVPLGELNSTAARLERLQDYRRGLRRVPDFSQPESQQTTSPQPTTPTAETSTQTTSRVSPPENDEWGQRANIDAMAAPLPEPFEGDPWLTPPRNPMTIPPSGQVLQQFNGTWSPQPDSFTVSYPELLRQAETNPNSVVLQPLVVRSPEEMGVIARRQGIIDDPRGLTSNEADALRALTEGEPNEISRVGQPLPDDWINELIPGLPEGWQDDVDYLSSLPEAPPPDVPLVDMWGDVTPRQGAPRILQRANLEQQLTDIQGQMLDEDSVAVMGQEWFDDRVAELQQQISDLDALPPEGQTLDDLTAEMAEQMFSSGATPSELAEEFTHPVIRQELSGLDDLDNNPMGIPAQEYLNIQIQREYIYERAARLNREMDRTIPPEGEGVDAITVLREIGLDDAGIQRILGINLSNPPNKMPGRGNLSLEAYASAQLYQGGSYETMNRLSRNRISDLDMSEAITGLVNNELTIEQAEQFIRRLPEINRYIIDSDELDSFTGDVFRGMEMTPQEFEVFQRTHQPGATVQYPGILSSTTDETTARVFASPKTETNIPVQVDILGTRGRRPPNTTGEDEIFLLPDRRYTVESIEQNYYTSRTDGYRVRLRDVTDDPQRPRTPQEEYKDLLAQLTRRRDDVMEESHHLNRAAQEIEDQVGALRREIDNIGRAYQLFPQYGRSPIQDEIFYSTRKTGEANEALQVQPLYDDVEVDFSSADQRILGQSWYHGTRQTNMNVDFRQGGGSNEYGVGLYLTNDIDQADIYSRMIRDITNPTPGQTRLTPDGRSQVFQVTPRVTNPVNLDAPAEQRIRNMFIRNARKVFGEPLAKELREISDQATNLGEYWLRTREAWGNLHERSRLRMSEQKYRQFAQYVARDLQRYGFDALESPRRGHLVVLPDNDTGRVLANYSIARDGIGSGTKMESTRARNYADHLNRVYHNNPVTRTMERQSRLAYGNAMMEDLLSMYNDTQRQAYDAAKRLTNVEEELTRGTRLNRDMEYRRLLDAATRDAATTPEMNYQLTQVPTDYPCL